LIKLNSLTSFRFVAAFMVYLCHSVSLFNDYQLGYTGVSFFFVLSGFILFYNYHSKFSEINSNNLKKFYMARIAKVYPVHLLTLALSIPYLITRSFVSDHSLPALPDLLGGFFENLFMVQSFIPLPFGTVPYSFNLVSWSLSDELFFYAIFPFIVCILLKLMIKKAAYQYIVAAISFYVGIICLIVFLATVREIKQDDWFFYVFPIFRSLDFIMGIFIGMIFVTTYTKFASYKRLFSLLEITALLLFVVWVILSPHISQVFRFSTYYVPVWCLIIYIFAFQGGWISKLLANRWCVFLGEISFSFYMVHILIINYMGFIPMSSFLNHLITLIGSILFSALIYLKFEEPIRKKIRGYRKEQRALEYKTVSKEPVI
jgi:peptidoglycan/LPS O-acetylase OafA/YrhL